MSPEIAEAISQAGESNFSKTVIGAPLVLLEVSETLPLPEPNFEEVKDLYCDKPLSFAARTELDDELTLEDQEDIKNALESHNDPGSTKLEDFEKELGL